MVVVQKMRGVMVALVATVLLAGCGSSADPTPDDPASSSSPSATPSGDAPVVDRPENVRSDAGAKAFSTFVVGRVAAVSAGEDLDVLLGLSRGATCTGCVDLGKSLQDAGTVEQEFDGAPTISDVEVAEVQGDGYLVEQSVVLAAGRKVDTETDETVESFDETPLTFSVSMNWIDDQWILRDYSVEDAS